MAERPFSGTALQARRSPLCEVWSVSNAPDFEPICSETGLFGGLPVCSTLGLEEFSASDPLYCAAKAKVDRQEICKGRSVQGFGEGPDYLDDQGYFVSTARVGDAPVIGLYCS